MSKNLKPIPYFNSEAKEREFWQTHDSTEYVDWSKAKRGMPITLRLPAGTIDRLKIRAHKMDIPYQSLIKQMIFEGLAK